jgi:hypothetical protein
MYRKDKNLDPLPYPLKNEKKSFLKKTNPPSPPLCTCPMKEKKKTLTSAPSSSTVKKSKINK